MKNETFKQIFFNQIKAITLNKKSLLNIEQKKDLIAINNSKTVHKMILSQIK